MDPYATKVSARVVRQSHSCQIAKSHRSNIAEKVDASRKKLPEIQATGTACSRMTTVANKECWSCWCRVSCLST